MNAPARPMTVDEAFGQARGLLQAGRLAEAHGLFRRIAEVAPDPFEALHLAGICRFQAGDYEHAAREIGQALRANPESASASNNLGLAYLELGRAADALDNFRRAIALRPDFAEALNNAGNALKLLGRVDEAFASYRKALALRPEQPDFLVNLAYLYKESGRHGEGIAVWDRLVSLASGSAQFVHDRGLVLNALGRHTEALACFDRVLAQLPDNPQAHLNRAVTLQQQMRLQEALASLDRAIALRPDFAEAFVNRGVLLQRLDRFDAALASLDRAIALDPGPAVSYMNRGLVRLELDDLPGALADFETARAREPELPNLMGHWVDTKLFMCRWDGIEADFGALLAAIDRGARAAYPFPVLVLPSTPAQQLKAARVHVEDRFPVHPAAPAWPARGAADGRIRIGYFSADFREHPVAHLAAGLFQRHDRARFEVHGFYFGAPTNDPMHGRLRACFDHFLDVGDRSDEAIAALARERGLDIAIDLTGLTLNNRAGIFAWRAAPTQVNFLGYPGTLGAGFMDYIVADRTVIPAADRGHYAEAVAYLPRCYLPYDDSQAVSDQPFRRADFDLPEDGFVFCCFNSMYKVAPDVFGIWMALLRQVPGSVLWLAGGHAVARENLRLEAARHGVVGDRLIFARRMDELSEHLARHRLADLFLDTFHYNAHTTASDALWAGLPVLTRPGPSFASRVGASLLTAVGLPELIASSAEDYAARALRLATDPPRLAALRARLAANWHIQPLFDTVGFTRDLEALFTRMVARQRAGLPPECLEPAAAP